jgi:hypothetical protein
MNTTKLLAASAVVMFMGATVPSMAQQEGTPQRGRPAPAEKMAPANPPSTHTQSPSGSVGETQHNRSRPETTGQGPREERQSRPDERNAGERGKTTEHPRAESEHKPGMMPREERRDGASERDHKTDRVQKDERTNGSSQNRVEQEKEKTRIDRETTGQGAAAAKPHSLTPEKRTRIHELVVRERNAPRVNSPNFEVSIGTKVPRTVPFVALPRTIVEIEPGWRGYEYFLIGDQMVIVNPRTMEIVAIIDA